MKWLTEKRAARAAALLLVVLRLVVLLVALLLGAFGLIGDAAVCRAVTRALSAL